MQGVGVAPGMLPAQSQQDQGVPRAAWGTWGNHETGQSRGCISRSQAAPSLPSCPPPCPLCCGADVKGIYPQTSIGSEHVWVWEWRMCSEESSDTLRSRKKTDFYHTLLAELLHNDDQRQDLMVEIIFQKQAKKCFLKQRWAENQEHPSIWGNQHCAREP